MSVSAMALGAANATLKRRTTERADTLIAGQL